VTCERPQDDQEMDLEDLGVEVPDYSDGRRKPSLLCTPDELRRFHPELYAELESGLGSPAMSGAAHEGYALGEVFEEARRHQRELQRLEREDPEFHRFLQRGGEGQARCRTPVHPAAPPPPPYCCPYPCAYCTLRRRPARTDLAVTAARISSCRARAHLTCAAAGRGRQDLLSFGLKKEDRDFALLHKVR
jgi:hypothetical protein